MWRSPLSISLPILWLIALAVVLLLSGVGRFLLDPPWGTLHDTYYVIWHWHYDLALAGLFGIFALWYFAFPKVSGLANSKFWGTLHFGLTAAGATLVGISHIALLGAFRFTAGDYRLDELSKAAVFWNQLSEIGSYLAAAGLVCFVLGLASIALARTRA